MKRTLWTLSFGVLALVLVTSLTQRSSGTPIEKLAAEPKQPEGKVMKSEEEWKEELTPEQFHILRKSGTEPPNGQVYKDFKTHGDGKYYCAGCGAELFSSDAKFDSGSGWPSFWEPSTAKNIKYVRDVSHGMMRVEVRCAVCDGHLGHVFEGENYGNPVDKRYCINGTALAFHSANSNSEPNSEATNHQ